MNIIQGECMNEVIYQDGFGTITGGKNKHTGSIHLRIEYKPSKHNGSVLSPDSFTFPEDALEPMRLFLTKMRYGL